MQRPLQIDTLEDRSVPATFGNAWPAPEQLTVSFAPEGTDIAGRANEPAALLGTEDGQLEVLRALQTWAAHAPINFSVTGDDGSAFGAPGPHQGSPNFGDIRVGSAELSAGELAIAAPFDLFNTWSGEVVFNSTADTPGRLFEVMLHEAGHTLGLGNDPLAGSVMYTVDDGSPRSELTARDVDRLQELYGPRRPDAHEGLFGNDGWRSATPLNFSAGLGLFGLVALNVSSAPRAVDADLTDAGDVDFYQYEVPRGERSFSVALKTSGLSLTQTSVTVYDERGRVVAADAAADPRTGDLLLTVDGARGGYFIKVEGATDDVFGVGAYRLGVGPDAAETVAAVRPEEARGDIGLNDSMLLATPLLAATLPGEGTWEATGTFKLDRPGDVDHYRVVAPLTADPNAVIAVWGLEAGTVEPEVAVFDLLGREVDSEVLSAGDGTFAVQVRGVSPLEVLHVRVAGAGEGDYFLGVDFREEPYAPEALFTGELDGSSRAESLEVDRSQVYRFRFTAGGPDAAGASVVLKSADGAALAEASAGDAWDILLDPGTYTLEFTADGGPVSYSLSATVRTDPLGPTPPDQGGSTSEEQGRPGDEPTAEARPVGGEDDEDDERPPAAPPEDDDDDDDEEERPAKPWLRPGSAEGDAYQSY